MNHREGKKTFIVGGGDIGQNLAKQLAHTGHQVTLIDQSEDVVDTLGNSIDAICFQGNGALCNAAGSECGFTIYLSELHNPMN